MSNWTRRNIALAVGYFLYGLSIPILSRFLHKDNPYRFSIFGSVLFVLLIWSIIVDKIFLKWDLFKRQSHCKTKGGNRILYYPLLFFMPRAVLWDIIRTLMQHIAFDSTRGSRGIYLTLVELFATCNVWETGKQICVSAYFFKRAFYFIGST